MVSVSVRYLFYQPMDEKIKTWILRFPAKENPDMEKTLFNWPIVLQYDVKAKYRLISRKFFRHEGFSPECSLYNQPKATRVCIRSINQSNRSISVRLLFRFCSRVFISRSYENHSIYLKPGKGITFRRSLLIWAIIGSIPLPPPPLARAPRLPQTSLKLVTHGLAFH